MSSKLLSSTVQAHAVGLPKDINGIDPHWNLVKGIYRDIKFPVVFKQDDGKKFTDILDTGWPNLYLISERFKLLLEENSLTGWQAFPIALRDKKDREVSGYHGLSITGRCRSKNYGNSEIIERSLVPNGPICKFYKGVSIDDWDGSDFFMPQRTYDIFVSKRSANIFKRNKISNLQLVNVEDIEMDVNIILGKYGPQ